jgi:hypothetical protein
MNPSRTTTSSKASSPSVMSDLMDINKWFTALTNALKMVFVVAALLSALNATTPIDPTNPSTRVVQSAQLENYVAAVKADYESRLATGIIKEGEIDFADFLLIYSFTKEDLLGRCFYRAYNNATLLAGNTPANLRDFSLYHLLMTTVIISRITFSNSNSQDDFYRGLAIDTSAKMDAIIDLMRVNKCFSMTTSTTENLETATQFAESPNNPHSAVIFIFGDIKSFSANVAKYSEYPHEDENIIAANMVKFDVKIGKLHGTYSVVLTKPTLSPDFSRYFSELRAHCIPQILGIWNAHVCDILLIEKLHTVSHAAYRLIEKLVPILKDENPHIEDRWLAFDRSLTVPLDVNAARVLLMECIELLLAPLPSIQDEYGSQSLIIAAFSNIGDIVNQFCALMEPSTNSLSCVQSMPASVAIITSLDADRLVIQMNRKEFTPHMSILYEALSGHKDVNVMCTGDLNAHGYHNSALIARFNEDRAFNLSIQILALKVSGGAKAILPDTWLVSNINTPLSCTFKGTLKHQGTAKLSAYVAIPTKCEFVINVTVTDGTDEEHAFQTAQIQGGKFEMSIDVADIKKITVVANNAATGARVLCGLSFMALIVSFNDFC